MNESQLHTQHILNHEVLEVILPELRTVVEQINTKELFSLTLSIYNQAIVIERLGNYITIEPDKIETIYDKWSNRSNTQHLAWTDGDILQKLKDLIKTL